jgi:hypothetical protein
MVFAFAALTRRRVDTARRMPGTASAPVPRCPTWHDASFAARSRSDG